MRFIKDYMLDDTLRRELNALTRETFCFDFEDWVTGGFFEGDYIPYSYEDGGQMVANVSVNHMEFLQDGVKKKYIQIGTVMTKPEYRKKGYARELLKKVLADYEGKCDGIYLYGNLDALGFYDKMGFLRGMEYRYTLKETVKEQLTKLSEAVSKERGGSGCVNPAQKSETMAQKGWFQQAGGEEHKLRYRKMVRESAVNSAFEQINKYGLQMFYTADMEPIYYSEELDCYIALEMQEDTLYLQSIISDRKVPIEEIISRLPMKYDKLILGFTPCREEAALFDAEAYDGEADYRFFFLGEDLQAVEREKLYFPVMSHA